MLWVACVLLLQSALGTGCGGPRPPGGLGRLDFQAGRPDRLVLAGSPYEMGWWHGHLLRPRILRLHEEGTARLLRRILPASARNPGAPSGPQRAIDQHLALTVDQTLHRLSERMLQELDGMAAATGLEPEELIRLDVARDSLRMKGLEAGLPGAAGLVRTAAGFEVRVSWGGVDASWLAENALLIHRKPADGPESVALAWPGSVGALAMASARGRGFVLAEVEMRDKRRRGFGGGRPFAVAAREALRTSADAETLLAATTATMGHLFLGFVARPGELPPVQAMAGVGAFQGAPDPIYALEDDRVLALGPYEDAASPKVREVFSSVVEPAGLEPEERWLRLALHAGRAGGPAVHIRWTPGRTTFTYQATPAGPPREITLAP